MVARIADRDVSRRHFPQLSPYCDIYAIVNDTITKRPSAAHESIGHQLGLALAQPFSSYAAGWPAGQYTLISGDGHRAMDAVSIGTAVGAQRPRRCVKD